MSPAPFILHRWPYNSTTSFNSTPSITGKIYKSALQYDGLLPFTVTSLRLDLKDVKDEADQRDHPGGGSEDLRPLFQTLQHLNVQARNACSAYYCGRVAAKLVDMCPNLETIHTNALGDPLTAKDNIALIHHVKELSFIESPYRGQPSLDPLLSVRSVSNRFEHAHNRPTKLPLRYMGRGALDFTTEAQRTNPRVCAVVAVLSKQGLKLVDVFGKE
jgi:hypothetical protein